MQKFENECDHFSEKNNWYISNENYVLKLIDIYNAYQSKNSNEISIELKIFSAKYGNWMYQLFPPTFYSPALFCRKNKTYNLIFVVCWMKCFLIVSIYLWNWICNTLWEKNILLIFSHFIYVVQKKILKDLKEFVCIYIHDLPVSRTFLVNVNIFEQNVYVFSWKIRILSHISKKISKRTLNSIISK